MAGSFVDIINGHLYNITEMHGEIHDHYCFVNDEDQILMLSLENGSNEKLPIIFDNIDDITIFAIKNSIPQSNIHKSEGITFYNRGCYKVEGF